MFELRDFRRRLSIPHRGTMPRQNLIYVGKNLKETGSVIEKKMGAKQTARTEDNSERKVP